MEGRGRKGQDKQRKQKGKERRKKGIHSVVTVHPVARVHSAVAVHPGRAKEIKRKGSEKERLSVVTVHPAVRVHSAVAVTQWAQYSQWKKRFTEAADFPAARTNQTTHGSSGEGRRRQRYGPACSVTKLSDGCVEAAESTRPAVSSGTMSMSERSAVPTDSGWPHSSGTDGLQTRLRFVKRWPSRAHPSVKCQTFSS